MMDKEFIKESYQRLKKKLGHQPSQKEILEKTNISDYQIAKLFRTFSHLVSEMGDTPKAFGQNKKSEEEFLISYGTMVKKLNKIPSTVDWLHNNGIPYCGSYMKKFKINKWSNMSYIFLNFAKDKPEWNDIIHLIPKEESKISIPITESEECYVYFMVDNKNEYYKIGISNEPEWRERTLQSEKPSIKLIAAKKFVNRRIAAIIEKALHESYSHKRKRGEWFDLDDEDISEIKKTLEN
jgi:hypothetical protein